MKHLFITLIVSILSLAGAAANPFNMADTVPIDTIGHSATIEMAKAPARAEYIAPSGTLPVLHIVTDGKVAITSKKEYIGATYWLDPMGKAEVDSMGSEDAPLQMQIRGRGTRRGKASRSPTR